MERVAKEYGHEILRLPPYHCELNPIELAWAAEKNYVAGENKDISLDSVETFVKVFWTLKTNEDKGVTKGLLV